MADKPDQRRPVDQLADQLDRIEAIALDARNEARKAREESEATNGRLSQVEEDLYGHTEERKRAADPGLITKFAETRQIVFDLRQARDEAGAIIEVKRWMVGIGLSMLTVLIGLVALMAQLARTM